MIGLLLMILILVMPELARSLINLFIALLLIGVVIAMATNP